MKVRINDPGIPATLLVASIFAVSLGGWFTHLVVCFQDEKWGFLIAGAIFAPIGVIHGIGCWFGAW